MLKEINDEDLKVIAGTDGALFIIFNRYAAIFFLFMTLFNSLVFLPMYVTGHATKPEDVQDANHNTILIALLTSINIQGSPNKQIAVFTLMMIFYTCGAFFLMFLYWKKSMNWRYKKHSHEAHFLDHDIALHTVMISNIPSNVPSLMMTNMLREVFT